ncbi:hypothetical protein M422DRAFT_240557 [Sphaerobolus stellatus SS14]|nr:hypothetical protein M422DRAFT_240557 [Sphaerobolus stellatus SS14]
MQLKTTSAFFYGTLLHPEVLRRVIGNTGEHLQVAPAVLLDHTRHHVKGCDYPAMVPYDQAKSLFNRDLTQDEKSVRGTVVQGLTEEDVRLLDIFEGDEYTSETVSVSPLAPFTPLLDSVGTLVAHSEPLPALREFTTVQTYIWADRLDRLVPEVWSFDVFVKEKLWRWVGKGSADNQDFTIVDERRALSGKTKAPTNDHVLEANQPPEFGHALLSQFCFHKDYVNLNHGKLLRFFTPSRRRGYQRIDTVRERLAHIIGADTDEVVLVPNATHGVNTVLRNFDWGPDDFIVEATSTYGAIQRTSQYIHDLSPHPSISIMKLSFPTTHADIVELFRSHLRSIPRKPGSKAVAIIDSITSNPGCLMPWQKMVQICKEEDVWSVVDAAHSIGQEMNINLSEAQPDFWISNCHKWLYAKRGCAILYVPFRNQHIIRSTLPTSIGYVSPEDPSGPNRPKAPNFVMQFEWTGTMDFGPWFSVLPALEFREKLGGEKRINDYCHALAVKGAARLAKLFGTSALPEEFTLNMCNVELPLPIPQGFSKATLAQIRSKIERKLIDDWDCFAATFTYDGKWWTRCSAQVFNELADFDHVAKAFKALCAEIKEEHGL